MSALSNYLASMVVKKEKPVEPVIEPQFAKAGRIDFSALGMPEYSNCYAIVLDDVFTKEEMCACLAKAEASSPWEVAKVNATAELAYVMTDYRNGERIIYDDEKLSASLFEKIRPHLHEIEEIEDEEWSREGKRIVKKKMVKMNERLRFLRYPKGGYFRKHTDGCYITLSSFRHQPPLMETDLRYMNSPDGKQQTYYTVQIYLPSSSDGSAAAFEVAKGGATRFLLNRGVYVDVEPIPGRVLVFQHDGLLHTGEDVIDGVKVTVRSDILFEDA